MPPNAPIYRGALCRCPQTLPNVTQKRGGFRPGFAGFTEGRSVDAGKRPPGLDAQKLLLYFALTEALPTPERNLARMLASAGVAPSVRAASRQPYARIWQRPRLPHARARSFAASWNSFAFLCKGVPFAKLALPGKPKSARAFATLSFHDCIYFALSTPAAFPFKLVGRIFQSCYTVSSGLRNTLDTSFLCKA